MCPKPSNYFPGVTLTSKTSTTQTQPSIHESGPPPFFPKRTRSHYGTTMGLFQSFRYATININALVVSDRPQPFTMNFLRADCENYAVVTLFFLNFPYLLQDLLS